MTTLRINYVDGVLNDCPASEYNAHTGQTNTNTADIVTLGAITEKIANKSTTTTLGISDILYPSQKAVKTYVDTAVTGVLKDKGVTDCSANPNYPVAIKGDAYIVTVAGKIGGVSGKSVDISDLYFATADNAGGAESSVGTSWAVLEHNLVGALLAGNNLSDIGSALIARTNLGLAIGTDVEAHDIDLTTIAGLTPTNNDMIQRKSGAWTSRNLSQVAADVASLPQSDATVLRDWLATTVFMPPPSGDTTGAIDAANLVMAQAKLLAGVGSIIWGSGLYWLVGSCGNIPSRQHWYGQGEAVTTLRLANGQNSDFVITKGWNTGLKDAILGTLATATVTGVTVNYPGNTLTAASTTGVNVGDLVTCNGVMPGVYVTAVTGTTITLDTTNQFAASGATATFCSIPHSWGIHGMTLDGNGYLANNAGINPPTGLAVSQVGTAGTTAFSYRVTARNANGTTQATAPVTISNANVTLSGSNYNHVSWSAVTGATSYDVYRSNIGFANGFGEKFIANVASGTTYDDQDSTFVPGVNVFPMHNRTGGRVLAVYGFGYSLTDVALIRGAGVGWEAQMTTGNITIFGSPYPVRASNLAIRDNIGGGAVINGPTDSSIMNLEMLANGRTGSAPTNGLADLHIAGGWAVTNYQIWGGGVQYGVRVNGNNTDFAGGHNEDGITYLWILGGGPNRVSGHFYTGLTAAYAGLIGVLIAGNGNTVNGTFQNLGGGIVQFASASAQNTRVTGSALYTAVDMPANLIAGAQVPDSTNDVDLKAYQTYLSANTFSRTPPIYAPTSIVTTKGDIYAATGAGTLVRVGVGADGSALTADSTTPSGVSYAAYVPTSVATMKGDIYAATGAGTLVRVGVGADGSVLTANSAAAAGVSYAAASSTTAVNNHDGTGTFNGSVTNNGDGTGTLT